MRLFPFRNSDICKGLLALLLPVTGFSQTNEDLAAFRAKYPGHQVVCKTDINEVKIEMVKGAPVISRRYLTEHLVLDKNGMLSLSEGDISFSSFEKIVNLDAYSLVPTPKGGSKKVEATEFKTKDAGSTGSVFHDDTKKTTFIYPGVCEGALRVLDYTEQMNQQYFPFGCHFSAYIPIEKASYIIECDTAVHLLIREYFTKGLPINYTEKVVKNKRIYTWEIVNPPLLKSEDNAPSSRYYAPHVLAQIAWYSTKTGVVRVTETPQDLHNQYKDNVEEVVNEVPAGDLKSIADSVTAGLTTNMEKVKAIYYWVQDNVKYIAFEEGMGGFVPRQPSNVVTKRYGDCKDMASLIYSMLKSVDVPAYLTWVGSRDLPYRYNDFPSGYCDNHMITMYREDGKLYFLDATNSNQSYKIPTSFIQGKQAMVHISPTEFELVEIPTPEAEITWMADTTYIELNKTGLKGRSKTIVSGYYHSVLSSIFRDVPEKELNAALKSVNAKGNNSYNVTDGKISNVLERDAPIVMEYQFTIDNYVTSYENEVYVNMVLEKDFTHQTELKNTRVAPYELDNKSSDSWTVFLTVPDGYAVKSLPKNTRFSNDYVTYSVDYVQKGNQISMTLKMKLNFLYLYPEQFESWNEFLKIKKTSIAESVVLVTAAAKK